MSFFALDPGQLMLRARRSEDARKLYLDSETRRSITVEPNLNADVAIFVLSR